MNLKIWNRLEQASGILMTYLAVFCMQTMIFAALDHMLQTSGGGLQAPGLARQILPVLLPFLLWGVREKAKHVLSFMGAHLLIFLLFPALLGTDAVQRGVFALFAAGYVAQSFLLRFHKEEELSVREDTSVRRRSPWEDDGEEKEDGAGNGPERAEGAGQAGHSGRVSSGPASSLPPAAEPNMFLSLAAAIGSFVICAGLEEDECCRRIWYAALLFVLFFFANIYLRNLERFICFNQAGNARIPVRRMLRQGGGMTMGFGLIAVLALGACTNGSLLMGLAEKLKALGLWFLRGLFRLLAFLMSFVKKDTEELTEQISAQRQPFEAMEAAKQPFWAQILEKMISALVLLLLCALAAWLLYRLVLFVVNRFYAAKRENGEDREVTEEIRERLERDGRHKRRERGLPFFAGTPEERIRRCFLRFIRHSEFFRHPEGEEGRKRRGEGRSREDWERLTRGLTARQLGGQTGQDAGEEREAFEDLIALYEKARYGRACTREEAKRAEQAAARLLRSPR